MSAESPLLSFGGDSESFESPLLSFDGDFESFESSLLSCFCVVFGCGFGLGTGFLPFVSWCVAEDSLVVGRSADVP